MPILDTTVNIENRVVTPRGIPRLCGKEIPIGSVATSPHHDIDARAATQNFPHRKRHNTTVEARIRLTLKIPIPLAAKIHRPLIRISDLRQVIAASCFHQQHTNPGILSEATGNN